MKFVQIILMNLTIMSSSFLFANSSNVVTSMNSSGVSLSAWETHTGFDVEIQVASQDAAGQWSPVAILTDPSVCINSRKPQTAIDSIGNSVVVWIGLDPSLCIERIFGSMLVLGTWTPPAPISAATEAIMNDNFTLDIISGAVKVNWSSMLLITYNIAVRSMHSPTFGTWSRTITTIAM